MKLVSLLLIIITIGLTGCATPQPSTAPKQTGIGNDLVIRSALFGDGMKVVDVTSRVSYLLQGDSRDFHADAETLNADPLPGKPKCLLIDYTYKGKPSRYFVTSKERVSFLLLVRNARR